MIHNINARICTNGSVYVQYQEDGKAKDAALPNWAAFVNWVGDKFHVQTVATQVPSDPSHRN